MCVAGFRLSCRISGRYRQREEAFFWGGGGGGLLPVDETLSYIGRKVIKMLYNVRSFFSAISLQGGALCWFRRSCSHRPSVGRLSNQR